MIMSDLTEYGYAPGGYNDMCNRCGRTFSGDKRAWRCMECAIELKRDRDERQSDMPKYPLNRNTLLNTLHLMKFCPTLTVGEAKAVDQSIEAQDTIAELEAAALKQASDGLEVLLQKDAEIAKLKADVARVYDWWGTASKNLLKSCPTLTVGEAKAVEQTTNCALHSSQLGRAGASIEAEAAQVTIKAQAAEIAKLKADVARRVNVRGAVRNALLMTNEQLTKASDVIQVLADRVKCQAEFNGSADKAKEWAEQQVEEKSV